MTPITAKPKEAKVMVSNLPLLFARGLPTSLESMSLEELQLFMRFVLKCELNLQSVNLDQLEQPEWWPPDLDWGENILVRKEQRGKTSITLRGAIKACYTHHDCMYLLEFCRKLIQFTGGIKNLQVIDNRDGTRSLHNRSNKKLLVTFRSENQDYDKHHFEHINNSKTDTNGLPKPQTPAKKSTDPKSKQLYVSSKSDNTSDPSFTNCVDVYLCDTCDKDFDSLKLLLEHEKLCQKVIIEPKTQAESAAQDAFLSNMKLYRRSQPIPIPRKIKESERPRAANYDKFMEIDVASPLGRYIVNSSNLGINQMNPASRGYKSLEKYHEDLESKCPGTIKALKNSNANMDIRGKWTSSYKLSKKKANLWTHTYCFTSAEMEAKVRVMKSGLTPSAMKILRKCEKKKAGVRIKKLDKATISSVFARYAEMDRLDKLDALGISTKSIPTEISNITTRTYEKSIDDKVIDELLEDSSSDTVEEVTMLPNMNHNVNGVLLPENSFINFNNGFQKDSTSKCNGSTEKPPFESSSFIVRDEAFSNTDASPISKPKVKISVPRPLPELQRISYLKSLQNKVVTAPKEIECVDLCSSDED